MSQLDRAVSPSVSMTWVVGFRLELQEGLKTSFAHMMDLTKTTSDIRYAWVGSAERVKLVRRMYPNTKAMKIVRHAARDTLRPLPSGY